MSLLVVAPPSAESLDLRKLAQKLNIPRVRLVDDAVSGFGVLAMERPTLTLVDAQLRPTDGVTFVREVRGTPIDNRDAPIWLTTVGDADKLSIAAQAAGADGVLKLPVTEDGLWSALTRAQTESTQRTDDPALGVRPKPARVDAAASDRAKRAIERLLVEAEAGVSAWSRSGFDPNLTAVETSLDAAAQLAVRTGDAALLRALTISLAVVDECRRSADGDDRKIRAAVNDVRARLGPGFSPGA